MLFTAYKLTTTRNKYGDFTSTASVALPCHFREITAEIDGNAESTQSDAMAWFEPDSGVARNDLLAFDGQHYKVERIVKARKLYDSSVQFIKVYLIKYGTIS